VPGEPGRDRGREVRMTRRRTFALLGAVALVTGVVVAMMLPANAGTVTCLGSAATKVGTPGNDTINGTSGIDVINGLGGNDTINGLNGNDKLCGGNGNDTIKSGRGSDEVDGGNGSDTASYSDATGTVSTHLNDSGVSSVQVNASGTDS